MNVINEMPEDISARKQYRRYHRWFWTAVYVALIPILILIGAAILNRVNELPYFVIFIGMMISALGIFGSVFMYRSGH